MMNNKVGEPSKIISSAFEIREVSNQSHKYFAYYKKNMMEQKLDQYFNIDIGFNHNCKHLRKYIKDADGHNYYAFQYVGEYKVLRELIRPKEETILKIVSDIVSALKILHSNSIVGRCFNIDNIILINGQTPVLMEFGYYPKMDYKVPELVYSSPINEKIDVFQLGRIIYYLTVGKELPQYNLDNFRDLEEKINLTIAETEYSQHLKIFLQGLLHKDKSLRTNFQKLSQKFDTPQSSQLQSFYQDDFERCREILCQQLQSRQEQEVDLIESGTFIIHDDSEAVRIQTKKKTQISKIKQPTTSQIDLDPPCTPELSDEENLLPPDIKHSQILIHEQQDDNIQIDNEQIYKELINILPYYQDSIESNQEIWNQIYFSLYRFGLLQKLNQRIQNFKKLSDDLCLWKTSFALSKISIVLKQQLINDLNQDKNILMIDQQKWQEFVIKDTYYKRMKSKLQQDLTQEKQRFIGLTFSQLYKGYQIFKQIPPQNDNFQNNNLTYGIFEEYKIAYREILSESLNFFQNIQGREPSLIKLLILMCIKINNICDLDQISITFQYVAFVIKTKINSITKLEHFFDTCGQHEFDEFYRKLTDQFFHQNQQ